ncbi:ligand-binding sensor domain-containing diguanylate cyclase [Rhodanobacter sp. Col0626]|uniref:ligand-binding sensor domain-containing diguanylate cyclase n=1 Tax=Rhodanobacter sp. Col0626 TaxID=3415679 RepID=UPI003CED81DE
MLMLALSVLAGSPARAQQYSLQTYDRKSGLESLSINVLMQDHRGFVWAGTEMGLYRFDGSSFERMDVAQGFDKGEYVTAIAENPRLGRIWVATQSGLRAGDGLHFEKIRLNGKPLVADVGRPMVALDDGRLLLVRDNQLMVLSGGRMGQPSVLRPMFGDAELAAHPQLRNITTVYASHGRLWLGCDTALCHIDASGKVLVDGPERGVPADSWSGVLMDRQGTLWLRGVHHVSVLPAGATKFIARDVPDNDMDVIKDDGSFVEDAQGRILTSTNHGLARWDGKGWTTIDSSNGLPDIGVTALLFDRQGTLWLGTYGRGISRWNGYGLIEGWGLGQGFDSMPNWSILRLDQEHLWFGNELGGSVLEKGRMRLQPWPIQSTPPPRQILSMAKAADGAMWVGLYDHRILRYDPVSKRTTQAAQLPAFVKVLHFDREGRLWIGTVNGIYRIDSVGAPAQRIPSVPTTDQQCSDIAEGANGALWFACNEGMLRYAEGHWTRMQTGRKIMASGFSAVAVDADGSLWLGANEPGVFHATVHGDQLALSDITDVWLDNTLAYFVRRDHRGWIWVGGSGGVDIFDGRHWTHLSQDDGLLWDETDQNSFFEDHDGSIWIGSAIGVSHLLHPEAMVASHPRKVVITSVMHGTKAAKDGASVHIDDNRAPLVVRYAVLGTSSGSAPRFRYRLQGSEWVATSAHIINLTGLPSDDYRLEIQAIDDDHRTLSPPTYFDFSIPPPWWLAWWTYPLELLLLALIVALSWRWHSRRLLRQNRRLETMVDGRTAELTEEKRELELARAELYHQATHDSLTGLYNRKAILDQLAEQLEPNVSVALGLAVGLVDADHFKRINDTFGHQAGDATLLAIARLLQSHVREGDRLGRYGGEEILMLLPGIGHADAEQRMRNLQTAVSAVPHQWNGKQFTVTLSIGMVWIGREPASVEDLVRRADAALYRAKSHGRNRVVAEVLGEEAGVAQPDSAGDVQ